MKEIMVIVRPDKVGATKKALSQAGYPAFTCRHVMGRGKKLEAHGGAPMELLPKRQFTLMVPDEAVPQLVNLLMEVNSTGNHGDGRIFVLPVFDSYQVRNGEPGADAY